MISSLATSAVNASLAAGASAADALADGFQRGLLLAGVLGLVIVVIAAVSRQLVPTAEEISELAAVAA